LSTTTTAQCCNRHGFKQPFLLSDRAARSMIGYWQDTVVCLSLTLCIVAKRYIVQ